MSKRLNDSSGQPIEVGFDRPQWLASAVRAEPRDWFCHPAAIVEHGAIIGSRTRIWAFVHILPDARIGEDCNICDHTFIEGNVVVGNRVTIKTSISLWNGMTIEDDVFLGPNACFTNDKQPRSKQYPLEFPPTLLRQGCSMGANSTTLPGLIIGRYAMVGAGAVVTRNVPDFGLVFGNPARLVGWVCKCGMRLPAVEAGRLTCVCGQAYEQVGAEAIRLVQA